MTAFMMMPAMKQRTELSALFLVARYFVLSDIGPSSNIILSWNVTPFPSNNKHEHGANH